MIEQGVVQVEEDGSNLHRQAQRSIRDTSGSWNGMAAYPLLLQIQVARPRT